MAVQAAVAVLGAGGTMGGAMARNLARAGFVVRAWNRTPGKARSLADHGIEVAGTPAEAVDGAGIVLTMLSDAAAVTAAMDGDDGALTAMTGQATSGQATDGQATTSQAPASQAANGQPRARQPVWLQMSTIGEPDTDRCAQLAARHGLGFVDAPVLGTKQPAEQGQLVVLASGPERLREQVQPVFDAIGHRTIWVGQAGDGTRLKLVANTWVLTVTEASAESIALAEAMGLDPALLMAAVKDGPLDLPYLRIKAAAITERNFEPSFRLGLAAKDAGLVEDATTRRKLDLPLIRAVRRRLDEGAREHGDKDLCATYLMSAQVPRSEEKKETGGSHR